MADYTDNFTYTASTWLMDHAPWVKLYGASIQSNWIVANQASHAAAGAYGTVLDQTVGDDQYSEADAVAMGASADEGTSVVVRGRRAADGVDGAYFAQYSRFGGGEIRLYRYDSNGYNPLLGSPWTGTLADGGRMRIEVSGQSPCHISVKWNGAELFTFNDSATGRLLTGKPGIFIGTAASEGGVLIDNWGGGDLVTENIQSGAGALDGSGAIVGVGWSNAQYQNVYYRRRN